ncbi:hypothetical protein [Paludisphaera rhizosphaerae]|uniref:hypothetical protein n=1 Tax=Paludisphaera rhizosphaerae TaxID=2711216 RepID=UPI0019811584|nr:hypothetical protein [Paludisphaera rhizosphaerae]
MDFLPGRAGAGGDGRAGADAVERDFWPDHLCLTALFGAAAAWYLRDPRLIAGAAAIALATCFLDLGPPVGPDPLAAMVEPPAAPSELTIRRSAGQEAWARWRADQQLDAQRRLVVFVGLNALGFVGLLAVAWRMRRRALREAVDRSSLRRGVEPLPVLAIEEGVNGEFGASSRRRSRERRGLMGSYILALPLMAMIFGVVAFPLRSFEVDGIILVVVIAAAAVWYLREPRLAGAAIAYAACTWCVDPDMPLPIAAPLRWMGAPSSLLMAKAVASATSNPSAMYIAVWNGVTYDWEPHTHEGYFSFVDAEWKRRASLSRDDAQEQLYRFLILNALGFGALAATAAVLRKRRAASEAKEARAAARRAPPRLSRSGV